MDTDTRACGIICMKSSQPETKLNFLLCLSYHRYNPVVTWMKSPDILNPEKLANVPQNVRKTFFITRQEKEVCLQWGLKSSLWRNIFRPNVKCRQTQSKIVIGTRDLVNHGGVSETSIIKIVHGRGLCVLQQRFALLLSLALFLASVFCSLYCWTISTKQRKELVSRKNHYLNVLSFVCYTLNTIREELTFMNDWPA